MACLCILYTVLSSPTPLWQVLHCGMLYPFWQVLHCSPPWQVLHCGILSIWQVIHCGMLSFMLTLLSLSLPSYDNYQFPIVTIMKSNSRHVLTFCDCNDCHPSGIFIFIWLPFYRNVGPHIFHCCVLVGPLFTHYTSLIILCGHQYNILVFAILSWVFCWQFYF